MSAETTGSKPEHDSSHVKWALDDLRDFAQHPSVRRPVIVEPEEFVRFQNAARVVTETYALGQFVDLDSHQAVLEENDGLYARIE